MLRTSCRSVVIASISVTALLLVAGDASAGHRHRKAKNNTAAVCCPTTVNTVSHASNCGGGGCSSGYPSGYVSGYSGGCGQMHSPSVYPYSGQTTVSNRGYSTYGTTNYYPSTGHQGGGCSSCGGTSY